MCFFKKKPTVLVIPHPEEPPDYSQTVDNVFAEQFIAAWLTEWEVPESEWVYWQEQIVIKIDDTFPAPAGSWEADGKRHLTMRPEWANPGVVAHEQAHNSYSLLEDFQKVRFSTTYNPLKETDPLIKLLYSKNSYGLTNDIEGHAEIYRYLGKQIPDILKPFYPKLL